MANLIVNGNVPFDFTSVFNGAEILTSTVSGAGAIGFTLTTADHAYTISFVSNNADFTYPGGTNSIPQSGTISEIDVTTASGNSLQLNGLNVSISTLEIAIASGIGSVLDTMFSGNDTAAFTVQNFDWSGQYSGGAGDDMLTITGQTAQEMTLHGTAVDQIETLNLGSEAFNGKGQLIAGQFQVQVADDFLPPATLTVNDNTGAKGQFLFDATAVSAFDVQFTVNGGPGQDVIGTGAGDDTIGTGTGSYDFANGGAGNDVIFVQDQQVGVEGGSGDDQINLGELGQPRPLSAKDVIDGGSNDAGQPSDHDLLVFWSGGETDHLGPQEVSNIEEFQFNDSFSAGTYRIWTDDATVASGATLTIDASLLGNSNIYFNGGAETDGSFIFNAGQSFNLSNPAQETFIGGNGNDVVNFDQGFFSAAGNIATGGGDDKIYFLNGSFGTAEKNGNQLVATSFIDGGSGNDVLEIGGGEYFLPVHFEALVPGSQPNSHPGTLESIETVKLDAGDDYNFVLADMSGKSTEFDGSQLSAANFVAIDGSAVASDNLDLLGGAGNDTLTGGAGNDVIQTGAGNNAVNIAAGGNDTVYGGSGTDSIFAGAALNASDSVSGGGGNDTLTLNGNVGTLPNPLTLGASTLQSVETVVLTGGTKATGNLGYYMVLNDGNVASNQGGYLTIDGHTLTARDIMNIDASHVHSGVVTLWAGAGNDFLVGGSGNDSLVGGDGANTMTGGGGADVMMGGSGIDQYDYNAVSDSTIKGTGNAFDTILGFDLNHDRFHFNIEVAAVDNMVQGTTMPTNLTSFGNALVADLSGLQAGHAVLYELINGETFVVVNAHGTTGFHVNADYVIELSSALHLTTTGTGGLTLADFSTNG